MTTKKFDLEERTTVFSENIIDLCKKTPKNSITLSILDQLERSGTSIGANYFEANGASTRKDFVNKIYICKKESKETQYWLRLLSKAYQEVSDQCGRLWQEANELTKIFAAIAINSKVKPI